MTTGSVSGNVLTFTKGNGSTFNLTVDTGSATPINTGSFATTGSNVFIGNQTVSGSISLTGSINNVQYIDFNTASVVPAWKSGRVFWDNTDGCLGVYNAEADITLQVGQEMWIRVRNNTGVAIQNGAAVRLIGALGDNPLVVLAQSVQVSGSINTDNQILGLATHTIEDGTDGYVTTLGNVRGLNTNAYNEGDVLFVSSSAGQLTKVVPVAPYERIPVATVVKKGPGGSGIVYVAPVPPIDFPTLSSVEISGSYSSGDIWNYQGGVWKHRQPLEIGLATTGSNNFIGTENITGSVNISGSLNINGKVVNNAVNKGLFIVSSTDVYSAPYPHITSSNNNANIIFPPLTQNGTATGSMFISGSNNILLLGGNALGTSGRYNVVGSQNIIGSHATVNTSSLTIPNLQANILLGAVNLTLTTGSNAGNNAHSFATNINTNTITWNHPSASIGAGNSSTVSNNVNVGVVTSTTTGPTILTTAATLSNNIMSNPALALNHISSSINFNQNIVGGNTITLNNRYYQTGSNNILTATANIFGGQAIVVNAAGSPATNLGRTLVGNLIGGQTVNVSLEGTNLDAGGLRNSLIYGQGLNVSGSHSAASTAVNSITLVGRWNGEDNGLADSARTVFAVGTGTATGTRRTGLYVTSGSLVGVSGSFSVVGNSTLTGNNTFNGDTIMSSSSTFPLYVSGTFRTTRIHLDGNPFNSNPSSNLAAIRMDGNNQTLQYTNYDLAQITTQSFIDQYVNTGSLVTKTSLGARYAGTEVKMDLTNTNGSRVINLVSDVTTVTGSLTVSGSIIATGSVQGNVLPLTVTSNTASLNLNNGNFFELSLTGSQDIRIEPSNIKPGQTINIKLNTTGSGTVSFPTSVKQVSGSSYVPTTTVGTDIITMIGFDSTNLYLANVKNLI